MDCQKAPEAAFQFGFIFVPFAVVAALACLPPAPLGAPFVCCKDAVKALQYRLGGNQNTNIAQSFPWPIQWSLPVFSLSLLHLWIANLIEYLILDQPSVDQARGEELRRTMDKPKDMPGYWKSSVQH